MFKKIAGAAAGIMLIMAAGVADAALITSSTSIPAPTVVEFSLV